MSTKETGGESAFPTDGDNYGPKWSNPGMTLRDYFAAKAMQGLMGRSWDVNGTAPADLFKTWAISAYMVADAMVEARK